MTEQEIDALLAEFRTWLVQAAAAPPEPEAAPEAESVDLHTLVSQFVGLRHEVNLQTRATRSQQEQNAETLRKLDEALAAIETGSSASDPEQTRDELLRPFLKTLIDVHDALSLARREAQRVKDNVLPVLEQLGVGARPSSPGEVLPREIFVRFLGAGKSMRRLPIVPAKTEQPPVEPAQQAIERVRRLVDSLVDGYAMSLQRLERTLEQAGLEAIPAVGEPFDPEAMEVVEVVHEAGRLGTEVIDEVRRGYFWQGRVFRFAQVRVVRPPP